MKHDKVFQQTFEGLFDNPIKADQERAIRWLLERLQTPASPKQ